VSQVQILPWAHFPDMQKPPLTSVNTVSGSSCSTRLNLPPYGRLRTMRGQGTDAFTRVESVSEGFLDASFSLSLLRFGSQVRDASEDELGCAAAWRPEGSGCEQWTARAADASGRSSVV
jgi:hypothetical protein